MKKSIVYITLALGAINAPFYSFAQTNEQTRNFCRVSQMLIPIFLRGGNISGQSVCEAGGGTYQCNNSISLGAGICVAGGGSYQCNTSMSLGAGVCVAGGGSYQCNNSMSLGAGVCIAGGGTYQCNPSMEYAHGVCIAGGGSYNCVSSMSLGTAICISGGNYPHQCSGIGNDSLGDGICRALGGAAYQCSGVSVSEAICGFTGNCEGYDAASIAVSIVQTCGVGVLRFGIE
jgi:hypothetical protein